MGSELSLEPSTKHLGKTDYWCLGSSLDGFFFSLGAPKYKSEVKWEPEVLPIGCPPLSASQVLPCTLRAPRSNWKTTDVGQVLHFADEKTEAHGMKCLAQNAPIFADGTKRTTQVS